MRTHFAMLAAYNAWCNQRLYDAVAELTDSEYRADRGAFFKSIHGTLNHLLTTDRIWMRRITGQGDAPSRLDAILFEEFGSLRDARWKEDERIMSYVDGLSEEGFRARIQYRPITDPTPVEQPLTSILSHIFNHQTHHRGQVHALLTGLGHTAPALDLTLFQRVSGVGM
ncbi:DinB family protein [Microvirga puerhi]|uniref:DinB family protein n=1 Tax=Microvirga puerhi TaxID=2876078 RepID=A0ABS7VSS8_9HYPH|nr:DinB family protein [Microvirga puerhi]MBZ6078617.1 DinB family protein [Microvirga puerhi]